MNLPPPDASNPRRGLDRRRFLAAAAGGVATTALASACSPGKRRRPPPPPTSSPATAPSRKLRLGYVAEITGPNSSRGELVQASFDALKAFINDKLGGTYHGLTLEIVPADAPVTAADGRQAYSDLASQKVDAILWCSPLGLIDNLPRVVAGPIPVISVLTDIHSYAATRPVALTGAAAKGSMIFQTALPDAFAVDVMLAYASEDRGFASVGFLFDRAIYPNVDDLFNSSAAKRGLTGTVFPYDSSSGHVDLNGPLQLLKHAGAHVVMIYGLADQASTVASQLQTLDAKYVDTATAKRMFKPMLMGSRWATGDQSFARLAGEAAARGTTSTSALGSVISLPTFPMRAWLHDYRPDYNGSFPQGGEDGPADAAALVLDAVARAGSTKGSDVIASLESGVTTTFASGVGLSFAADRHLTVSRDDAVLLSVELPPTSYNLGAEWKEVLPRGYAGPTHLVDFTLAANTRAHAPTIVEVLQRRYGTSATDEYQSGDRAKVVACKAVH